MERNHDIVTEGTLENSILPKILLILQQVFRIQEKELGDLAQFLPPICARTSTVADSTYYGSKSFWVEYFFKSI